MDGQAHLGDSRVLEQLLATIERLPKMLSRAMADVEAEAAPRMARIERALDAAQDAVRAAERALEHADDEDARAYEDRLEEARDRLRALESAAADVRDALGSYKGAARVLRELERGEIAGARGFLSERLRVIAEYDALRPKSGSTSNGAANSPGALSPIVEAGGLAAHEAAGGHLRRKHAGKTESQLMARLTAEPNLPDASSFYNLATAEVAVSEALDTNSGNISSWLAGREARLPVNYTSETPVGIIVSRGANSAVDVYSCRIILVRDPSFTTGYRIQTGFPTKP